MMKFICKKLKRPGFSALLSWRIQLTFRQEMLPHVGHRNFSEP